MKKNNIVTGVISSETTPIATIAGTLNPVTNNFVLENITTIENIQDYYTNPQFNNPTSIKNPSITIYIGSDAINLIGEVADEFLNELFFRDEVNINKLISDGGVSVSISPCQPESKAALDCILGRTMVFGDPTATKTYSSAKAHNDTKNKEEVNTTDTTDTTSNKKGDDTMKQTLSFNTVNILSYNKDNGHLTLRNIDINGTLEISKSGTLTITQIDPKEDLYNRIYDISKDNYTDIAFYNDKEAITFDADTVLRALKTLPHNTNKENYRGKRASLPIFDDASTISRKTKHICSVCDKPIDSYLDIFTFDDGDYICRSCCNNLTDHALGDSITSGEKECIKIKNSVTTQDLSDSFRLYGRLLVIENMLEKLKSIEYVSQLQQIDIDTIIDTFVSDPLMQAELLLAHSITQLASTNSSDISGSSINGSDINSSKVESTSTSELSYMAAEMKKAFSDTDTTGWKAETDTITDKIDKFTQSVNAATIILNALDQIKTANTSITELQNTLVELSNTVHLISKIDEYDVLYEALDTLSTKGSRAALEDVAKKMNEKK